MSVRTIFLLFRGIDQSGRAMESVQKGLESVEDRQKSLANASYRLMFAGGAFMAFGVMAASAIAKIVSMTSKGSMIMEDFGRIMDRIKVKLAESILSTWEKEIEALIILLDKLGKNETFMKILSIVAPISITFIVVGLALMLGAALVGAYAKFGLSIITALFGEEAAAAATSAVGGAMGVTLPLLLTVAILGITWAWWEGMNGEKATQSLWDFLGLKGLNMKLPELANVSTESSGNATGSNRITDITTTNNITVNVPPGSDGEDVGKTVAKTISTQTLQDLFDSGTILDLSK